MYGCPTRDPSLHIHPKLVAAPHSLPSPVRHMLPRVLQGPGFCPHSRQATAEASEQHPAPSRLATRCWQMPLLLRDEDSALPAPLGRHREQRPLGPCGEYTLLPGSRAP